MPIVRHAPHIAPSSVLRLQIGALGNELLDHGEVALPRGHEERREPLVCLRAQALSDPFVLQQLVGQRDILVLNGEVQCREAKFVGGVDARAGRDRSVNPLHSLVVVLTDRLEQGRVWGGLLMRLWRVSRDVIGVTPLRCVNGVSLGIQRVREICDAGVDGESSDIAGKK